MIDKLKARLSKKEKGFTLIELLVVIAIIAILVLIVVVVINPAQRIRDANNATATSDVRSVASGVGACITKVLSLQPAEDPYDGTRCSSETYLTTNGYLQNVPTSIVMTAPGGTYICVSKEGGSGDYAQWRSDTGTTAPAPDGAACV